MKENKLLIKLPPNDWCQVRRSTYADSITYVQFIIIQSLSQLWYLISRVTWEDASLAVDNGPRLNQYIIY